MMHASSRSGGDDALRERSPGLAEHPPRGARRIALAGLLVTLSVGLGAACAAGGANTGNSESSSGSGTRGTGGNGTGGNGGSGAGTITTGTGGDGGSGGNGGAGGGTGGAATGGGGAGGGTGGNTASSSSGPMCVAEVCNGFDDDCNGQVDDGDPGGGADCDAPNVFGVCKQGKMHCVNGVLKCVPGSPQPETCNGLDDNCDSFVDEGILPGVGMQCNTGLMGLCAIGLTTCTGVNGVMCTASVAPNQLMESCNGQDDNCDGLVDNGIAQIGMPCVAQGQIGACQFGTYSCPSMPPYQLTCDHPLPGTQQEVCNGKDDDCNGTIDDPALVNGQPCNTAFPGVCSTGTTQCVAGSNNCNATVQPNTKPELCNNMDDDCNGNVDDIPNVNVACQSQLPNAGHVASWACTMASCQITQCTAGYADLDTAPGNGCECASDAYATACNNATTISVPIGGNAMMTGVVESAAGSDFVVFAFANKPVGTVYHPKIQLTNSAGGQYAFEILQGCGTPATCNDGGTGTNIDVWEAVYDFAAPGAYTAGEACCSDNDAHPVSMIVRVFRKNGDAPTCVPYTVTATNP